MWERTLKTCRFCGKHGYDDSDFVKYGVRHYAHNQCFLKRPDAADRVPRLHDWQIKQLLDQVPNTTWPIKLYCAMMAAMGRAGYGRRA